MCKIHKIELEFEIITLSYNIQKLSQLGFRTAELRSRLEYCHAAFEAMKFIHSSVNDDNYVDFTYVNQSTYHRPHSVIAPQN
jgi:hypothetical protein